MTMGFEDDGDPPTGNPGVVEDSVEDGMDMEKPTVPMARKLVEKSGSRSSLSRLAHKSSKNKDDDKDKTNDKDKYKINDEVYDKDKDNGQSSRVDTTRVGMVAGQSMEKSGNYSLQKKISGTSRLANTNTRTLMRSNGHATGLVDDNERVGMDLEALVAGQSMEKSTAAEQSVKRSGNNSLQKEASASSGTSR
jgi:hypothetical protein